MPSIKYKDSTTGNMLPVSVKVGDTLPVGTEIDYDGESVPLGWEQVADGDLIVSPTEPSGNDRRKVWLRHSENLYNKNNSYVTGGNNQNCGNKIYLEPSTTYTFSIGTYTWGTIYLYNSANTNTRTIGNTSTSKLLTFTTDADTTYAIFIFNAGTNFDITQVDFTQITLNKGSETIEYEPYVYDKTFILNDNNIYEEFINNEPVVLWKNPSRTAIFSNQTITLNDSLTNYKFYEIIFNRTNGDYTISTGRIPTDRNTMLQIFRAYGFIRGVEIASNTTLTIGEATRYDSYGGSNTSTNNNYCIPEQILGYK